MAEERVEHTDSGSRMVLLGADTSVPPTPDLLVLEELRDQAFDDTLEPAHGPPHLEPGSMLTWHYSRACDPMRVVSDDARGLVAWLSPGTEHLVPAPAAGGAGLRSLSLQERFTAPRVLRTRRWQGPGVLRTVAAGEPWSVWFFFDDDGTFEGHYVNIELPHQRPVLPGPATRRHTRDLVLDLWLPATAPGTPAEVWLKDDDELDAAVASGFYRAEQAAAVREVALVARHRLVEERAWPMGAGWETWTPPPGWQDPLPLPPGSPR